MGIFKFRKRQNAGDRRIQRKGRRTAKREARREKRRSAKQLRIETRQNAKTARKGLGGGARDVFDNVLDTVKGVFNKGGNESSEAPISSSLGAEQVADTPINARRMGGESEAPEPQSESGGMGKMLPMILIAAVAFFVLFGKKMFKKK